MRTFRYAGAIAPLLIVAIVWLAETLLLGKNSRYLTAYAAVIAAFSSIPVTAVAFVKLYRGSDTAWVVTALLASLPVFLLLVIGVAALITR